MTIQEQIQHHFDLASGLISKHVETLARDILSQNPDMKEFVMGMGSWCFWGVDGEHITCDDPRTEKLNDFIGEWERNFQITGEPMRFTAKGKRITNW